LYAANLNSSDNWLIYLDPLIANRSRPNEQNVRELTIGCAWKTAGVKCLRVSQICDGKRDCDNGMDENNCGGQSAVAIDFQKQQLKKHENDSMDVCFQVAALMPDSCRTSTGDLYNASWTTPMAHSDDCDRHRLPWRMHKLFIDLANDQSGKLCLCVSPL
jgi:hypothetical protein